MGKLKSVHYPNMKAENFNMERPKCRKRNNQQNNDEAYSKLGTNNVLKQNPYRNQNPEEKNLNREKERRKTSTPNEERLANLTKWVSNMHTVDQATCTKDTEKRMIK
ncbi:hypothetical protein TorRG33x02_245980 [Trema orientale]|uniref:Uncharacterized protein n=1 Tax=Trema orientale TaxID=63057 RepID=A0A2P5DNG5_TREOI|nr:hypothetical protein TorRG33x02_245980 [Trema orientale]